MKKYVGVKLVEAQPMTRIEFHNLTKQMSMLSYEQANQDGYLVIYPDGYKSWSPKEVFENAYMQIGDNNTITETNVNEFVEKYETTQWGDKTTVVHATLVNGFIMSESSSCVDSKNFNMDIGENICKDRIHNKLWGMLGFLLQCGVGGIKRKDV